MKIDMRRLKKTVIYIARHKQWNGKVIFILTKYSATYTTNSFQSF